MKTLLLAASIIAAASLLTACPLAPTCGGYAGDGDRVYARANSATSSDSLIACDNGGVVETIDGRYFEGRFDGTNVIDPATGAIRDTYTLTGDDTATTGGVDWAITDTNTVTLDHADALCRELTTRTWWTAETSLLPVATAFALGTDTMLLCADGTAVVERAVDADGTVDDEYGYYSNSGGSIYVTAEQFAATGTFENPTGLPTDGALITGDAAPRWTQVDPASVTLSCAR